MPVFGALALTGWSWQVRQKELPDGSLMYDVRLTELEWDHLEAHQRKHLPQLPPAFRSTLANGGYIKAEATVLAQQTPA